MSENEKPSPADREEELVDASELDGRKAPKGEVGEGVKKDKKDK